MDKDKVVCRCFGITAGEIEEAVKSGNTTFEEVQDVTSCATGCGACEQDVRDLIEELTN